MLLKKTSPEETDTLEPSLKITGCYFVLVFSNSQVLRQEANDQTRKVTGVKITIISKI
jgi:hypothetical protein